MEYKVICRPLDNAKDVNGVIIVGMASVLIENKFAINSIRLAVHEKEGRREVNVFYPSRKSSSQRALNGYLNICYPSNSELRSSLKEAIIKSYNEGGKEQMVQTECKYKLNTFVNLYDKGATKGFALAEFGEKAEFKVNDISVLEGKNGLFVAMPSYKKNNGEYATICNPMTKEFGDELSEKVLEQYEKKQTKDINNVRKENKRI